MTPASASMSESPCPLTVVILTFNEERNLRACLESVRGIARDMFVVDSGSSDATPAIAATCGASVIAHPFETHARQWTWALRELPIRTDWVLALDADQRVSSELAQEIARAVTGSAGAPDGVHGYLVSRRQIFRGRWIRHGGYYPKYLLKLFRRASVVIDASELVDHHFDVTGPVATLRGDLIEDNQNESAISAWTAKHNRYAVLQARQELRGMQAGRAPAVEPASNTSVRRRRRVWSRLPLFVRPCLYFGYRYVLRLGFLDGKEGFVFHVLQAFWYRLLVDINIDEMRRTQAAGAERAPEPSAVVPETADGRPRP